MLERCLRLEAELARARGIDVAPLLPPIERRNMYDHMPSALRDTLGWPYTPQRRVTADQAAEMRALRSRGLTYLAIARRLNVSHTTVRRYARDVLQ